MERGLLSSKDLAPLYDQVVWFYLFQDFTHSEADLQAERMALRFGISSWPRHFLIDPANLSILADTGRSLESFRSAVASVEEVGETARPSLEELRAFDSLAAEIRRAESWELADENLGHADPVVRVRAAERLAADRPRALVARASDLLKVEHDQLRYLVCRVLADAGDVRFARELDALLVDPGRSHNPNVVRCEAARALASCGDARSLRALRPFATSGDAFNALTGLSLDALVGIAEREPRAQPAVRAVLVDAFPPLPETDAGADEATGQDAERSRVFAARLARHVHASLRAVTGEERDFPSTYDAATRKDLVEFWAEVERP